MRVPLADLPTQYQRLKADIDAALLSVLESGHFLDGEPVRQLEHEIATLCGAAQGIAVASGTDALLLALKAAGIEEGQEVITSPFTFAATAEAIALLGARPVFVDIDPCTFLLDEAQIEAARTPRTKALLPVDLFGQMVDRQALEALASKHGLAVIYDGAQAIGARQQGGPLAAWGEAVTLSFYPTKNLGAYGDGGMVLTNSWELAAQVKSLRSHGVGAGGRYGYHERVGYCSRLDSLQAAVLLVKLSHLAAWTQRRREHAARYQALLSPLSKQGLVLPGCGVGNYHVYHQYTVRHPQRERLQAYLLEQGIESKVFYPLPLHLQAAFRSLGYREGDFPQAEQAAKEVLSLPIHPELTSGQVEYVAEQIHRFFEQAG